MLEKQQEIADYVAPRRVLLASPRGWCAGVQRAVDTVEQALELHGPPIYVRKQIVHNIHVVRQLEARGAIFVEDEAEIPRGSTVVLSAHGVAPSVHKQANVLGLNVVDATCPLVTKVHKEALKYVRAGYAVVLIGHEGHEEVVGTMGEAPDNIVLVGDVEEVDGLPFDTDTPMAYVTQTTLSVDETATIIRRLRERFPQIVGPKRDDICYATTNRQQAVKQLAAESDVVLVIGSQNSSNSVRLAEVASEAGTPAYRIDDESEIRAEWVSGVDTVGVTSGASAPESLVACVCDWFLKRGTKDLDTHELVDEGVHFMLPTELRVAIARANT